MARAALAVASVAALAGCAADPVAPAARTPAPAGAGPLRCPVPAAAGAAHSDLSFTGACGFGQREFVTCPTSVEADDFHFTFARQMSPGLTIYVSVTVEEFEGPGAYHGTTTILVKIPAGNTLYEWSTRTGSATIGKDRRSGTIARTALAPAIGTPTTGTEYVEGRFSCRPAS